MYSIPNYKDREPIDTRKLIACTKKILSELVYNMAYLEGNPFTFPEVQTLFDGITIGGHKLSDQDQVIRIRDSWELVFKIATKERNKFK